jgi:hypothetical protein
MVSFSNLSFGYIREIGNSPIEILKDVIVSNAGFISFRLQDCY